jgi:hypothetical protein
MRGGHAAAAAREVEGMEMESLRFVKWRAVLLFVAAALSIASLLLALSYRELTYVDRYSGDLLKEHAFGNLVVHHEICDTSFSSLIPAHENALVPSASNERFALTNCVSFIDSVSPHYRYHSVPYTLNMFVTLAVEAGWDRGQITARGSELLSALADDDLSRFYDVWDRTLVEIRRAQINGPQNK